MKIFKIRSLWVNFDYCCLLIANQVGIRPDRQEKYDFSDPYISSSAVLITHETNDSVSSFEDIEGLKAAQSMTSNYADMAKSYGAEIVGVDGFNCSDRTFRIRKNDLAAVLKCTGAAYFRPACHRRSSPRLFSEGLEKANSSLQAPYGNGFSEL